MTSPILVTGGTGTLGRLVVPLLRDGGSNVRVLSRLSHAATDGADFVIGDLTTGAGIDAALAEVETVVHLAGSVKGDAEKMQHLVQAAVRAGVRHLVFISVVGADRIPMASGIDRVMFGYFGAKLAAERLLVASGLPWTTLRATQFHEAILVTAQQLAKLPVMPVPAGFKFQPVDAGEVAARLVELTLGQPAGRVGDMGGPRAYDMAELLRGYLRASHLRRLMLPMWLPGKAASAVRAGATLASDLAVGKRSWEDFLAERVGVAGKLRPPAGVHRLQVTQ